MKNKKRLISVVLIGMFLILLANLISASYTYSGSWSYGGGYGIDIRSGSEQLINFIVNWAEPFLQVLLGGYDYTGYLLFEKFLLFLLFASIVYLSLKQISMFSDNKGVLWTITIIVPLLAVRFLDFAWINTILVQYQVLGVAMLGILPFIIYLFFIHGVSDNSTVRKIGWIFFIVVYFGLWSTTEVDNYAEVYFWTMIIAFLFLLFDGTIHRALLAQKYKESVKYNMQHMIAKLDEDIRTIQNSSLPKDAKDKHLRKLLRERDKLIKYMTR